MRQQFVNQPRLTRGAARLVVWVASSALVLPGLVRAEEPEAPVTAQAQTDDAQAAPDEAQEQAAAAEAEAASEAEMDAADVEAREHFRIGKTLYEAGRFQQAGEEFQTAYELSKRPQLLYNVFVAFRDAADFPKAIAALRAYLKEVPDAPDAINLKARLASMEQVQAEREAAEQSRAEHEAAPAAPSTRTEVERSKVPLILLSVGGGLVAGAIVTGALTMKRTGDLDGKCADDRCARGLSGDVDSARAMAITTDVLLFTGLATAAAGLVLHLTGTLDEERQVPVTAGCSLSGCGMSFSRRF